MARRSTSRFGLAATGASPSETRASASIHRCATRCSSRFSRPRIRQEAPASASRSSTALPGRPAARSPSRPHPTRGRPSRYCCRSSRLKNPDAQGVEETRPSLAAVWRGDTRGGCARRLFREARRGFPGVAPCDRCQVTRRSLDGISAVARRASRSGGRAAAGRDISESFEWTVEPVEDLIELQAPHVREGVARHVVRRRRRTARIWQVVRVILRLEHAHYVRAARLRSSHHVRSGAISLPPP